MKFFNLCVFCIILSLFFGALLSCPTCIGRLSQDSPPFFTDEAYQLEETKKTPSTPVNDVKTKERDTNEME